MVSWGTGTQQKTVPLTTYHPSFTVGVLVGAGSLWPILWTHLVVFFSGILLSERGLLSRLAHAVHCQGH